MTLLDQFEAAWRQGPAPDWRAFARRPEILGDTAALVELIQIDLERRWKSAASESADFVAARYLSELNALLENSMTVSLIAWEYHVRNRWGDCPTRHDMLSAYGDLPGLDAALTTVARRLLWPQVLIELNHELRARAEFDQVVSIGRCAPGDPGLFGMLEHAGQRRITVALASDVSVSRNQLQLRLTSPQSVAVTNSSEARSLLVAGCNVLPAGRRFVLALPVCVQLTSSLHVRVECAARAHPHPGR